MRPVLWLIVAAALMPPSAHAQWFPTAGPGHAGITTFLQSGGVLYAGTNTSGTYRSSNDGADWTAANGSLEGASVNCLAEADGFLFAGLQPGGVSPGGVFRSSDGGVSWSHAGMNGRSVLSLLGAPHLLLAGTVGAGVFRSTDDGATWNAANDNIGNQSIGAIVATGGVTFASGDNNLYRSTDGGLTWHFTNGGQYYNIACMFVAGSSIYAGGFDGILRSTDGGASFEGPIWIDLLQGLTRITSFALIGTDLYASTAGGPGCGVIRSQDGGTTWAFANGGITNASVAALAPAGEGILAGSLARGLLRSTDSGSLWNAYGTGLPGGTNIRVLLAAAGGVLAGTGGDGPYRTTDAGANWSSIGDDPLGLLRNEIVAGMIAKGSVLLATGLTDGVFRSMDAGAHWGQSNTGLPTGPSFAVQAIGQAGANVVLGSSDGIFVSSDSGQTWSGTNVTFGTSGFAAEPGFAYAIVSSGVYTTTGIYRSTNSGVTWNLVFPTMQITPSAIAAGDGFVYLGDMLGGLYRSSDHGVSWNSTSLTAGVFAILPEGATVYAGADHASGGMFRSPDHGATWTMFNLGLPADAAIEALAADGPFLYAGDDQRGVWRTVLGPADAPGAAFPAALLLGQPHPEPFESSTEIVTTTAREGPIEISLFDNGGRRVRTVFDGRLAPGQHAWRITRDGLPAGVYYLHADAGDAHGAQKLTVLGRR